MSPRIKRICLWLVALSLGLLCGKLIHTASSSIKPGADYKIPNTSKHLPRSFAPISSTGRYLWSETAELRDPEKFQIEVQRIHREARSPLRATSLLSFRIQNSSFEEWEHLLAEGEVKRIEVLGELGEYLARTDTERALDLCFKGPYSFENLDQVYAFRDPLIRTAADSDPEMVLEKLKEMRRGGAQMDNSLFFSQHWAARDPRAAAGHFVDLVKLRNMSMDASPNMPDKVYANMIMKSWLNKDPDEAREYVGAMTDGPTRDALTLALTELAPPE